MPTNRHALRPLTRRRALIDALRSGYTRGQSIRALAADHGLTYSTVRNLLIDGGVELRDRNGSYRRG